MIAIPCAVITISLLTYADYRSSHIINGPQVNSVIYHHPDSPPPAPAAKPTVAPATLLDSGRDAQFAQATAAAAQRAVLQKHINDVAIQAQADAIFAGLMASSAFKPYDPNVEVVSPQGATWLYDTRGAK